MNRRTSTARRCQGRREQHKWPQGLARPSSRPYILSRANSALLTHGNVDLQPHLISMGACRSLSRQLGIYQLPGDQTQDMAEYNSDVGSRDKRQCRTCTLLCPTSFHYGSPGEGLFYLLNSYAVDVGENELTVSESLDLYLLRLPVVVAH